MPRIRTLVVVIACAVVAVLGVGAFTLAEAASGCSGPGRSGLAVAAGDRQAGDVAAADVVAAGCAERLGAAVEPGAEGSVRAVPISTATRHVPAPGERIGRHGTNPATDRAMALLVGWGVLVLIIGGLSCGRSRAGVSVAAPALRVRLTHPRQGAPRHLLGTPAAPGCGRRGRPGLGRPVTLVRSITGAVRSRCCSGVGVRASGAGVRGGRTDTGSGVRGGRADAVGGVRGGRAGSAVRAGGWGRRAGAAVRGRVGAGRTAARAGRSPEFGPAGAPRTRSGDTLMVWRAASAGAALGVGYGIGVSGAPAADDRAPGPVSGSRS